MSSVTVLLLAAALLTAVVLIVICTIAAMTNSRRASHLWDRPSTLTDSLANYGCSRCNDRDRSKRHCSNEVR